MDSASRPWPASARSVLRCVREVVITIAWCASRSSSAVVSFSSPAKTVTHSAKARFVVTTIARRHGGR
jgi:hypothetical protein